MFKHCYFGRRVDAIIIVHLTCLKRGQTSNLVERDAWTLDIRAHCLIQLNCKMMYTCTCKYTRDVNMRPDHWRRMQEVLLCCGKDTLCGLESYSDREKLKWPTAVPMGAK